MTLFIILVCIIALLFLIINFIFAPHNPYQEKYSMFECGFHSWNQTRLQFNITFFIYGLIYLLLDLEILLLFPFATSEYVNNLYGLMITLIFILIITIGFIFELGKGALKIDSRQKSYIVKVRPTYTTEYTGNTIILKASFLDDLSNSRKNIEQSLFRFRFRLSSISKQT